MERATLDDIIEANKEVFLQPIKNVLETAGKTLKDV